jgi:ethanolamine utilization protein EutA
MDIGGGTSNLALIRDGRILQTTCLNVGGRLIKFDESGIVTYVSPVLEGICLQKVGQKAQPEAVAAVAEILVQALEMAAGLREKTELFRKLWTKESGEPWEKMPENVTLSFSGGVADCIEKNVPWLTYGDMGPVLGQAIRKSRLCQGEYVLGEETIRATVIGAGCHSTQLSGSTVFYQNVDFPLQNVPVVTSAEELEQQETAAILALGGQTAPTYGEIKRLAGEIAEGFAEKPVYVCMEQDMAKALGQALALRLGKDRSVLCIDRVKLDEGSYLDVGAPVGPALPVVVKTLVLGR